MEKLNGKVKWFDNVKGYGFIVNEAEEDVFVHHSCILGEGYKTLAVGQNVEFFQCKSDNGWKATDVVSLDKLSEI